MQNPTAPPTPNITNAPSHQPDPPPEETRDCDAPSRFDDDKNTLRQLSVNDDTDLSRGSSSSSVSSSSSLHDDLPAVSNHHSLPYPEDRSGVVQSPNRDKLLQTIAGVAGNVLEWYDFAVFGYFADIIGDNFFPPQEGHGNLMDSYVVFGVAFFMRPIGGIFMGYIGDSYGRKRALEISIFLMAFPTFLMGVLPTYKTIGISATVLLVLVRLLQGLSVGGQLVSSLVFTLENQPREKWGLYGSYVMASANVGTLLGSLLAMVLRRTMDEEALRDWGWRVPFLSGVLVVGCGVYLRFFCEDDVMEHQGHNTGAARRNPLVVAFSRGNLRALVSASLVPTVWAAGFYITFVWMAIFMHDYAGLDKGTASMVNSLSLLFSVCIMFPVAGIVSDWYGRAKVMYFGGVCLAVGSPMMILCISHGNAVVAFFAQSAMGISLSLWGAPMMAWLVESFPSHVRLTSVAIGYNMALALFGGSSGALATYLTDKYGTHAPGLIVSAVAVLAMVGLFLQPKPQERANRAHEVLADLTLEEGGEKEGMFSYDETEMI